MTPQLLLSNLTTPDSRVTTQVGEPDHSGQGRIGDISLNSPIDLGTRNKGNTSEVTEDGDKFLGTGAPLSSI